MYNKTERAGGIKRNTPEYELWINVKRRCLPGGETQSRRPSYTSCEMSSTFLDFQEFARWCNAQIGFRSFENGRAFHLDKDILVKGNKLYSEDTCVFVPLAINCFLVDRKNLRGQCKIGVSYRPKEGKYVSMCNKDGALQYLGLFDSEDVAFTTYKNFKEAVAKELAIRYHGKIDERVVKALETFVVQPTD